MAQIFETFWVFSRNLVPMVWTYTARLKILSTIFSASSGETLFQRWTIRTFRLSFKRISDFWNHFRFLITFSHLFKFWQHPKLFLLMHRWCFVNEFWICTKQLFQKIWCLGSREIWEKFQILFCIPCDWRAFWILESKKSRD